MSRPGASLSLLARALTGLDVTVQALDAAGGARAVIAPGRLLVPEADAEYRVRRAMVAHAVAHLRYSAPGAPAEGRPPMSIAVLSAIEDARVERLLCGAFPGVHGWFVRALAPSPDDGDLSFAALLARLHRRLLIPGSRDANHWVNKAHRLFEETVRSAGLRDQGAFRAVASVLANDLGQMRVRFEPHAFVVPAPYRDDNSWLWTFGEHGTEPLTLAVASVAARGAGNAATSPARAGEGSHGESSRFAYPEWDYKRGGLRKDWCTLLERAAAGRGDSVHDARDTVPPIRTTRLPLSQASRRGRWHRLRGQREGEELDLCAAVDATIERRAGRRSEARVFLRHEPDATRCSTLVLLDLSESTNAGSETGLSLLDLEKRAAWLLFDATWGRADRLAVHGFSSDSRNAVHYHRLLDFGRAPDTATRAALQDVHGRFSTRMGAALRHATFLLRREKADRRSILVVTDGEPSDIDAPDPRYLVEDALVAVAEARRSGVRIACLLVGAGAKKPAHRIFGSGNCRVVATPARLPLEIRRVCERLARTRSL